MDLDNFELDEKAIKAAEQKREQKPAEDEKPVKADNDCDGCKI